MSEIITALAALAGVIVTFFTMNRKVKDAETRERVARQAFMKTNDTLKMYEQHVKQVQKNAEDMTKIIEKADKAGKDGDFSAFTKTDY